MVRAPITTKPKQEITAHLLEQAVKELNEALRILHVDDTEGVLHLQRLYLARRSHLAIEYVGVMNSSTALQTLSSWQPDLILSDISRPCMDGYTFTELLKSRADTKHIPVAFLTASAAKKDIDRAFAVGASALFTKPGLPHTPKLHQMAAQHRVKKIAEWVASPHQFDLMETLLHTPDVERIMQVEIMRWLRDAR